MHRVTHTSALDTYPHISTVRQKVRRRLTDIYQSFEFVSNQLEADKSL